MTTYLVATLSTYVLVDAQSEHEARSKAREPLNELLAEACKRTGFTGEIPIQTVRHATQQEIDLWRWHHEMLEAESEANSTEESK